MFTKSLNKIFVKQIGKYNFSVKGKGLLDYHFVSNLSEELIELRQSVRKFCNDKVLPLADQTDRKNAFPNHLWKEMGDMGLLGISIPSEYGGSDMNYTAHCLVMEEISRASGSIGLSYGAHTALCMSQIERHGTKEQKEKYLPKLTSGDMIGALSMSEPNAGSDVVSMKTKAVKHGDKWVVNGNKMWCTNGPDAGVYVLYAKTNVEKNRITAFLLDRDTPGFSTAQKLDKLGMRGSNTCELVLENVEIPDSNILGEVDKGVYVLMSGLDYERLILSAGPVGIMQACLDECIPYIQTRNQFGKAIGEFQLMQGKIADMYVKLQSSRAYMYAVSQAVDKGLISNTDCAALLLSCSINATQVALEAIQTLGGNGYTNDYPVGRFLRDAKLYEIGAGTNEIRRWLIGRELFHNGSASN